MKKILLLIAAFAFLTALSAQITQEESDKIVLEYLGKVTQPYTVYAKEEVQTEMAITTSAEEILELDYPCWVYYINYTGEMEKNTGRYLIVNENNGNLLEVNAKNDAGPDDLAEWRVVKIERMITPVLIAQGDLRNLEVSKINWIVKTEAEWEKLKITMGPVVDLTGTNIDFNAYQVIAVFGGERDKGNWTIDITTIMEYPDSIVVTIQNIEKDETPVIIRPYQIVKIPLSGKKIVFQHNMMEIPFMEYSLEEPPCDEWNIFEKDVRNKLIIINSYEELEKYIIDCTGGNYPAIDFSKHTLLLRVIAMQNGCTYSLFKDSSNRYVLEAIIGWSIYLDGGGGRMVSILMPKIPDDAVGISDLKYLYY